MGGQFEFSDPAGMHFSQEMCNDVLHLLFAAGQLDNPRGRDLLLLDLNSKVGDPNAVKTVGSQFDDAMKKVAGHFGLVYSRKESGGKGKKRRAREVQP